MSFSNQRFEKHHHYSFFSFKFSLFIIYNKRGFSSAGRAPALQAGGQRFEPANLHQEWRIGGELEPRDSGRDGPIAQLARAHD